jgi:hypothetical protein
VIFNRVLAETKPLDSIAAEQVLREAFDQTFGIFDHLKQAQIEESARTQKRPELCRPLASVALHPAEDWAGEKTHLDLVMEGFAENRVAELFNISFLDFLDLPVEYAARLMKISKLMLERRKNRDKQTQNEIESVSRTS